MQKRVTNLSCRHAHLRCDFLHLASLPGKRHDPRCSRAEALTRLMAAVRRAAGPDVFILGAEWEVFGQPWLANNLLRIVKPARSNARMWVLDTVECKTTSSGTEAEVRDRSHVFFMFLGWKIGFMVSFMMSWVSWFLRHQVFGSG